MTVTGAPSISVPPAVGSYDEMRLLSRLSSMLDQAREAKKTLYRDWRRNWSLANNRVWSQTNMTWMPKAQDSEIYPILANLIGWLTDQNVSFTVQAATTPGSPWSQFLDGLAADLSTLLQSNWKKRNQERVITSTLWDASLYGVGILKAVWDASADKGMGDANFVRVDPWDFYVDPAATYEEDASYFFELRRMSFEEIELRFPDTADRLLSDVLFSTGETLDSDQRVTNVRAQGDRIMAFTQGYPTQATAATGLPGQGTNQQAASKGPEDIIVYECWFRENREGEIPDPNWEAPPTDPLAERPMVETTYADWRVVVFSARTVLMDVWASDLWQGATHPYARVAFDEVSEFWPTSLTTHLAPAQIMIDRLLSAIQQSAELCGNPIFVEPAQGGGAQTFLTNRPGQRLRDTPMSNGGNSYRWLAPPQMSADVMGLVNFWIGRMENIAGLSQVAKGRPPTQRTPESVVSQTQESGFIRVRSVLRNLERALRKIGEIEAQLIVENYTTDRIVSILGTDGGQTGLVLRARHFLDAVNNAYAPFYYSLLVNAGSEVPTSRQARISEAQNLFALKGIDQQALLEIMNFPHWQQIVARMKEEAAIAAQQEANQRQKTGRKD